MMTLQNYSTFAGGKTVGDIRKHMADVTEEYLWDNEIESQVAYLYDWYHDDHQTQLDDLKPYNDEYKVPMDIKFIVASSQTMAKDEITYHLQMRPSQKTCVDYYDEVFKNRYAAVFPCGLYLDIRDAGGKWNRWLVVATADYNDPQFPTFEILRCGYVLNAIIDGVKYNIPVALRSQSSYNSGLWRDYRTETIEDQQKFMAPLNRLTEKIWYNKRYLIDEMVIQEECRAWRISKINRVSYKGLIIATLVQDHFNKDTDLIEKDSNGNTIALWADYYSEPVVPEDYNPTPEPHQSDYGVISVSGKNEIKVGGSYKKLSINFFSASGRPIPYKNGEWGFEIDDTPVELTVSTEGLAENQIKVKIPSDDGLYINKVLKAKFVVNEFSLITTHEISVVSL